MVYVLIGFVVLFLTNSPADLRSKVLGPRHAGPIFFIFVMSSGKFGQIIGWRPPLGNSECAPVVGNRV